MDADSPGDVRLTDTQHGILAALCRPFAGSNRFAVPATDQEIAAEVFLGVDAVEGQLRTLYREFGIEDLPGDQRRARLVELAIEGGYVGSTAAAADAPRRPMTVAEETRLARAAEDAEPKRQIAPYVTAAILILVVIGGTLSISGIFNSSPSAPAAPSPAAFRTEVAGYCKLALAGAPAPAGRNRGEVARGYLEVIETMRGRLESLTQPTTPDIALERFGTGLTNAANYTGDVVESPPTAGSPAEAKDVAELTFAAGQVQAGAVGYGLGHECLAIGELVAASAENAAQGTPG
jgi:hypothetical protein